MNINKAKGIFPGTEDMGAYADPVNQGGASMGAYDEPKARVGPSAAQDPFGWEDDNFSKPVSKPRGPPQAAAWDSHLQKEEADTGDDGWNDVKNSFKSTVEAPVGGGYDGESKKQSYDSYEKNDDFIPSNSTKAKRSTPAKGDDNFNARKQPKTLDFGALGGAQKAAPAQEVDLIDTNTFDQNLKISDNQNDDPFAWPGESSNQGQSKSNDFDFDFDNGKKEVVVETVIQNVGSNPLDLLESKPQSNTQSLDPLASRPTSTQPGETLESIGVVFETNQAPPHNPMDDVFASQNPSVAADPFAGADVFSNSSPPAASSDPFSTPSAPVQDTSPASAPAQPELKNVKPDDPWSNKKLFDFDSMKEEQNKKL